MPTSLSSVGFLLWFLFCSSIVFMNDGRHGTMGSRPWSWRDHHQPDYFEYNSREWMNEHCKNTAYCPYKWKFFGDLRFVFFCVDVWWDRMEQRYLVEILFDRVGCSCDRSLIDLLNGWALGWRVLLPFDRAWPNTSIDHRRNFKI